jgi:hypothetical protein
MIMKHFGALDNIENEISSVEQLSSLLGVICSAIDNSTHEEIESAVWYVQHDLAEATGRLRDAFECLFSTIRAESNSIGEQKIKSVDRSENSNDGWR